MWGYISARQGIIWRQNLCCWHFSIKLTIERKHAVLSLYLATTPRLDPAVNLCIINRQIKDSYHNALKHEDTAMPQRLPRETCHNVLMYDCSLLLTSHGELRTLCTMLEYHVTLCIMSTWTVPHYYPYTRLAWALHNIHYYIKQYSPIFIIPCYTCTYYSIWLCQLFAICCHRFNITVAPTWCNIDV